MTDYEQLKAEIDAFRLAADVPYNPLPDIGILWGFVRQLQDIIEAAITEPTGSESGTVMMFADLPRGAVFWFTGKDGLWLRPGMASGYEAFGDPDHRLLFCDDPHGTQVVLYR